MDNKQQEFIPRITPDIKDLINKEVEVKPFTPTNSNLDTMLRSIFVECETDIIETWFAGGEDVAYRNLLLYAKDLVVCAKGIGAIVRHSPMDSKYENMSTEDKKRAILFDRNYKKILFEEFAVSMEKRLADIRTLLDT